jgi:gamma-glutamyl phosphate reductase
MAQTPREIVLDVHIPGMKEAIRNALEIAWEDGYEAALHNANVVDDLDSAIPWINNPFTED